MSNTMCSKHIDNTSKTVLKHTDMTSHFILNYIYLDVSVSKTIELVSRLNENNALLIKPRVYLSQRISFLKIPQFTSPHTIKTTIQKQSRTPTFLKSNFHVIYICQRNKKEFSRVSCV